MIWTLTIINLTAAIAGGFVGWSMRGRSTHDDRSERIVKHLATWVAIMNGQTGQKVADSMLYSAACIHYRDHTEAMDSAAAARFTRARVNELVIEAADHAG